MVNLSLIFTLCFVQFLNSPLSDMTNQTVRTAPVIEGRGDVELELAVAGEGDLDDGGAGGVVDGAPVVQVLDVVP